MIIIIYDYYCSIYAAKNIKNNKMKNLIKISIFTLLLTILNSCKKNEDNPILPNQNINLGAVAIGGGQSDRISKGIRTTDGFIVTCGYTISFGAGDNDILVTKCDGSGSVIWSKTYGTNINESAYDIKQTSDNGFIIAGTTTQTQSDILIIKTDESGTIQWSVKYAAIAGDKFVKSIIETIEGGYLVCGVLSESPNPTQVFCLKISNDGSGEWFKTYGGDFNDYAEKLIPSNDGGFVICGSTFSFGAASGDGYIIKLYGDGILNWSSVYGGDGVESLTDIIQSGNDFVTGGITYSNGLTDGDLIIFKTDINGYTYPGWLRTLGSDTRYLEQLTGIAENQGGYTITATTQSSSTNWDILIANFYGDGAFKSAKVYTPNGIDYAGSIIKHPDGYLAFGYTNSYGIGDNDGLIMNIKSDSVSCLPSGIFNPVGGNPSVIEQRVVTIEGDFDETTEAINLTSGNAGVVSTNICQ